MGFGGVGRGLELGLLWLRGRRRGMSNLLFGVGLGILFGVEEGFCSFLNYFLLSCFVFVGFWVCVLLRFVVVGDCCFFLRECYWEGGDVMEGRFFLKQAQHHLLLL